MKIAAPLLIVTIFLSACGSNSNEPRKPDSVEMAEEYNDEKFDDTDIDRDIEFALKAASGGMAEVEMGSLALQNAASQAVKDFGQKMIDEHKATNQELRQTARAKNITLPSEPALEKQEKIRELAKLKGKDFDKEYITYMVKDHKEDIELFKEEADKGRDAGIRAWAGSKVPMLEGHLRMAEDIEKSL